MRRAAGLAARSRRVAMAQHLRAPHMVSADIAGKRVDHNRPLSQRANGL